MFLGIDPGMSGAMALRTEGWKEPLVIPFKDLTEMDVHQKITAMCAMDQGHTIVAMLELVHATPIWGLSSTWKFGQHYGFIRGIITANKIPFEVVTPVKWQKAMGCLTKGDKNVSKAAAQRLFPTMKITHAIADALLIAEYCRRIVNGRDAETAAK